MDSKFNEYSEEENRMNNGHIVMSVLANLGDAASAEKICDEIVYMSDQPREIIEPEVKRILRRGISNGFLVKFGKNYLLSGEYKAVEVDSKRNKYKDIGKRNKRKSNIKSFERIDNYDEDNFVAMSKNVSLRLNDADSTISDDQLLLLNPRKVVNGVISDLFKLVNPSEETAEDEDNVVDLEAILSKNLNSFAEPFDVLE